MKGQWSKHAEQDVIGEAQCLHQLQESHCRPVRQLLFNTVDASCSNLFATVGGDQATVYDDMHMGDYIAVVLNFVNARTLHAAGQVGTSCSMLLDTLRPVRCWGLHGCCDVAADAAIWAHLSQGLHMSDEGAPWQ